MKLVIPTFTIFEDHLEFRGRSLKKGSSEWKVGLQALLKMKPFSSIPHRFVKDHESVGWSGKEQTLLIRKSDKTSDILHEFCHYLLCPEKRLKKDEFGLGQGFRSNAIDAEASIGYDQSQNEECAVCILAFAFMLHLKRAKRSIINELYEQRFYGTSLRDYNKMCRHIIKKKDLLAERGVNIIYSPLPNS